MVNLITMTPIIDYNNQIADLFFADRVHRMIGAILVTDSIMGYQ
jgi:hypothetical protein